MKITNTLYRAIPPAQRAAAIYAALNRGDYVEAGRLLGQAPRGGGHGKCFIGLGQALDVYNRLAAQVARDALPVICKLEAALAYAEAWLDAGGAADDARYLEKFREGKVLSATAQQHLGQLAAVKEVTREWCQENGIPVEIFSPPLAILPVVQAEDSGDGESIQVEETSLGVVRSLFNEVKVGW